MPDDPIPPLSDSDNVQPVFVRGLLFHHCDGLWRVTGWDYRVEGVGKDARVVERIPVMGYIMTEADFDLTVAAFVKIYRDGDVH